MGPFLSPIALLLSLLVQLMHIKIGELCLRPNCRIDIHGGLHSGGEIVDGVDGHGDAVAAVGE